MEGKIYFAYGSCMNEPDFRRTVPNAVLLGGGTLPDHRLDFTTYSYVRSGGAADVITHPGSTVEGVAWFVPEGSMKRLDAREGAPVVYARQSVSINLYGNESPLDAITYSVKRKQSPSRPTNAYLKLMVDGGRAAGLPEEYIENLISHASGLPEKVSYYRTRSGRNRKRSQSSYVWDNPTYRVHRLEDDYDIEDTVSDTSTRAFFTTEELISGKYGDTILDIPAEEWEYMTDEEIEAEIENYNWWNDSDYSEKI